jgi:uncharacterized phage protein (TIGR02220 family)
MAWLKVETHTPDKPEIFDISLQLNITPDDAFGKCFRIWAWFDSHTTNGKSNGIGVSWPLLDRLIGVTGFAEAMHLVGWLDGECDDCYIPNFDRHNGESAKTRALTAKRVAKHKANKVTEDALPREEKRREDNKEQNLLSSSQANCDQVQLANGKSKFKEAAIEVLDFLNLKTGRQFRRVTTTLDPIAERLKSGVTIGQCKQVIAMKVREWQGTDQSKYLRPETLFRASKFESYLGQLEVIND